MRKNYGVLEMLQHVEKQAPPAAAALGVKAAAAVNPLAVAQDLAWRVLPAQQKTLVGGQRHVLRAGVVGPLAALPAQDLEVIAWSYDADLNAKKRDAVAQSFTASLSTEAGLAWVGHRKPFDGAGIAFSSDGRAVCWDAIKANFVPPAYREAELGKCSMAVFDLTAGDPVEQASKILAAVKADTPDPAGMQFKPASFYDLAAAIQVLAKPKYKEPVSSVVSGDPWDALDDKKNPAVICLVDPDPEKKNIYTAKSVSFADIKKNKGKWTLAMWCTDEADAKEKAKDLERRRTDVMTLPQHWNTPPAEENGSGLKKGTAENGTETMQVADIPGNHSPQALEEKDLKKIPTTEEAVAKLRMNDIQGGMQANIHIEKNGSEVKAAGKGSFAQHAGQVVEILKEGTLEELMDAFPEAADKLEATGVDYVKAAQTPYVCYRPQNAQIPVLVPKSEVTPSPGLKELREGSVQAAGGDANIAALKNYLDELEDTDAHINPETGVVWETHKNAREAMEKVDDPAGRAAALVAFEAYLTELEDADEDKNPETGKVYESHLTAKKALAAAKGIKAGEALELGDLAHIESQERDRETGKVEEGTEDFSGVVVFIGKKWEADELPEYKEEVAKFIQENGEGAGKYVVLEDQTTFDTRVAFLQDVYKDEGEDGVKAAARSINYKGYTIEPSGDNFKVRLPEPGGYMEGGTAVNVETAKKWIQMDINERNEAQRRKEKAKTDVKAGGSMIVVFNNDGTYHPFTVGPGGGRDEAVKFLEKKKDEEPEEGWQLGTRKDGVNYPGGEEPADGEDGIEELRLWLLNDEGLYNAVYRIKDHKRLQQVVTELVENRKDINVDLGEIDWEQLLIDIQGEEEPDRQDGMGEYIGPRSKEFKKKKKNPEVKGGRKLAILSAIDVRGSETIEDPMLRHYLVTALWASSDDSNPETGGVPLENNYNIEDFTAEAINEAKADCDSFKEKAGALIEGVDPTQVGHDFFLTRNRHGAGFWDRPEMYGGQENADKLTELAHGFGESNPYLGDDKRISFSGNLKADKEYSLAEIEAMPTIEQGHTDNLKMKDDKTKVWLSRMTKEDGMKYNNGVIVERLVDGVWTVVQEYEALGPNGESMPSRQEREDLK